MTVYELRILKSQYETLKSSLSGAVSNLSKPSNLLLEASSNIGTYYKINDVSADNKSIEKINSDVMDIVNKVNNTIIPAINSRIYQINMQIQELEALEGLG